MTTKITTNDDAYSYGYDDGNTHPVIGSDDLQAFLLATTCASVRLDGSVPNVHWLAVQYTDGFVRIQRLRREEVIEHGVTVEDYNADMRAIQEHLNKRQEKVTPAVTPAPRKLRIAAEDKQPNGTPVGWNKVEAAKRAWDAERAADRALTSKSATITFAEHAKTVAKRQAKRKTAEEAKVNANKIARKSGWDGGVIDRCFKMVGHEDTIANLVYEATKLYAPTPLPTDPFRRYCAIISPLGGDRTRKLVDLVANHLGQGDANVVGTIVTHLLDPKPVEAKPAKSRIETAREVNWDRKAFVEACKAEDIKASEADVAKVEQGVPGWDLIEGDVSEAMRAKDAMAVTNADEAEKADAAEGDAKAQQDMKRALEAERAALQSIIRNN